MTFSQLFFWGIPIIAFVSYCILFLYMSISQKTKDIKNFMIIIGLFIIWTGSSIFMRMQLTPGVLFWNKILVASTCFVSLALYYFVAEFTESTKKSSLFCWTILTGVVVIVNMLGYVVTDARVITTLIADQGNQFVNIEFAYELGAAILPVYGFFFLMQLATLQKAFKSIKVDKASRDPLLLIIIGIIIMFMGSLLNLIPTIGKYPFDLLCCFINAILITIALYYGLLETQMLITKVIFENMTESVVLLDKHLRIFSANLPAKELLGITSLDKRIPLQKCIPFYEEIIKLVGKNEKNSQEITTNIKGKEQFFLLNVVPFKISKYFTGWSLTLISMLDRKKREEELRREKLNFEALFRNSTDAIIHVGANQEVLDVNSSFEDFFGYSIQDMNTKHLHDLDELLFKSGAEDKTTYILNGILQNRIVKESLCTGSNGWQIPVKIKGIHIFQDNKIIGGYIIFTDISEQKKREAAIYFMSYHDQLTGLYNRRFFEKEKRRLDEEKFLPLSVVIADINDLKLVNDSFGHESGDRLLIKAAEIIQSAFRDGDIVVRFGGDEFIILLPNTSYEQAGFMVQRIKKACQNKFVETLPLMISVGWATKNYPAEDIESVIKRADAAMYKCKREGR